MRAAPACGWLRGWRRLLCALALGLAPLAAAHAEQFVVRDAATELNHDVYQLNARIDYNFSSDVLNALENGVPITLRIDIEVQRKRRWWVNETVATLEQRYQLTYHAFSDQYLVRNLNSNALYTFPSLGLAIDAIGTLNAYPLLDARFVDANDQYKVDLRTELDIEALPAPLRPIAYLTPAWRLSSDWYECSLTP